MMDEYIERDAAIEAVKKERDYIGKFTFEEEHAWAVGFQQGISFALSDIATTPAADVRPVVRVKWEDVHIDRPEIADLKVASMFCPNCNRWHNEVYHYGNPIEFANFCQFCGADMRSTSMSGANGGEES